MSDPDGLLGAVADTLVPGVRIEDDGALRAALAPVARAVAAGGPGSSSDLERPSASRWSASCSADRRAAAAA